MEIRILRLLEGAKQAEGLAVIIDVFRAFSLEAYLYSMDAAKKTKLILTNSDGCTEKPPMVKDNCAPKDVLPTTLTTVKSASPSKPYSQGILTSCHTRSMISGTIRVTVAAASTSPNWRMALSGVNRVRMIKLVHKSIHALFTRSLDEFL